MYKTSLVVFQCKLRSVEFHPTAQVLLAAGAANQTLSLFQVGKLLITVNPVLLAAATITVVCSRNEDENAKSWGAALNTVICRHKLTFGSQNCQYKCEKTY